MCQPMDSIAPTFYEQFAEKSQSQTVSSEKLRKTLSFKKAVRKMFVKLTPSVNFINILLERFLFESEFLLLRLAL